MPHSSGRALYLQIADDLRAQITAGALRVGDPVPSTAGLADQYGHSSTVVRRAIELLRGEGLVLGQPGKAVYVHATPAEVETERASVQDLLRQVGDLRAELRSVVEQLRVQLNNSHP
jgi:GntR family transcriptional regulator